MIAHPIFRPHLILEYRKRFNEEPFTKDETMNFTSVVKNAIRDANEAIKGKIKAKLD